MSGSLLKVSQPSPSGMESVDFALHLPCCYFFHALCTLHYLRTLPRELCQLTSISRPFSVRIKLRT